MKISTAHHNLRELLHAEDVLIQPEKYLGPNFLAVLNFWIFVEKLTIEQLTPLQQYNYLNRHLHGQLSVLRNPVVQTAGENGTFSSDAIWYVAPKTIKFIAAYATWEILAAEKLIENNYIFTYLPVFQNL